MNSGQADERHVASSILMIRPVAFRGNPETAGSNRFQRTPGTVDADSEQAAAAAEFQGLVRAMEDAGIRVIVVEDTLEPDTPDSVFPNNWVSFHADGRVVLYPMMAPNRRDERRRDILEHLSAEEGFRIDEVIDLSAHELDDRFLEGTGSLVLDRVHRIAYACISPRTSLEVLGEFGQRLGYEVLGFDARDRQGIPIYHTNVLMCVGEKFAVICDEAMVDEAQREAVLLKLRETGHEIVSITRDQKNQFAGNLLELQNDEGERILAMSRRAEESLTAEQKAVLTSYARIVSAPIEAIEDSAGGGVRCMMAEIHLPHRS